MREILFKGKRIDGMGWIEGYYANCCYPDKEKDKTYHFIVEYPDMYYEIFTNTLGQYTGLTDKNGKKIFEGDVVFVTDENGCSGQVDTGIGEIIFLEGLWYIDGRVQNVLYDIDRCFQIEVIGNIYDNPELLEVEE